MTGSFAIELSGYDKLSTTCLYMYVYILLFIFINCVFVDNFDYTEMQIKDTFSLIPNISVNLRVY